MGLFGYNEKDYNKQSEDFKSRLQNIMENTYDRGVDNFGVGKVIGGLMIMIDKIKYNKAGKDHKVVDQIISDLLTKMEEDAMNKRFSSLISRADNLRKELDQSRRYGKNAFTADERQAEDTMAKARGGIYDALNQLGEIEKKKAALIERASKVGDAERQKIKVDYNALDATAQRLNREVAAWTSRYNTAVQVVNTRALGGLASELESAQVCDARAFEKEMADIANSLEKQMGLDATINEGVTDFNSSVDSALGTSNQGSSSFDALVEDAKNERIKQEAGPFSVSSSSGTSVANDPFEMAMNSRN